ncbi:hypothetical protein SCLCIDRAFT_244348 [Scleroderma citrinum Foug A]|uniref:Uncharacterized protein n=1 Tax=Scleroderma citrinum Foug A TaxID=1036808 RepID=A0A0C2Z364_9AGAM|nr:hypothetical protein SCLCIDRAFT_244348 [Scleroderma citrinum Foug A]
MGADSFNLSALSLFAQSPCSAKTLPNNRENAKPLSYRNLPATLVMVPQDATQ